MSRRRFLRGLAGIALSGLVPCIVRASRGAHVVIIGGGFAGGACATWLKRLDPQLRVTLIERNRSFPTGFFCNTAVAGLRPFTSIRSGPAGLAARGVSVRIASVVDIDPVARRIRLADGTVLSADALVVAPGIDMRLEAIPGFGPEEAARNPPAWPGSESALAMVRARLRALPEGGTIAVVAPPAPYRCPPGPYERVSLFAHHLRRCNPRAKILILDAKDAFSKQALFQEAWGQLYAGMIEWHGRQDGATAREIDQGAGTVLTASGERVHADWVHVIPAQRAGRLAQHAGLCAPSGWIDVHASDLSIDGLEHVYALGDAVQLQPMPKSAFAAYNQAVQCARAIVASFAGAAHAPSAMANTCYSLVGRHYAFSVSSRYEVSAQEGLAVANAATQLSPLAAGQDVRQREAREAEQLYRHLRRECFNAE
ncbi:FAD-dependent oxidoreductase [Algiphilus aromaticivorans]|uniref:FAD-dependent oxidoreductase n=1 Tax=Algiphilus aromaticivorans TaxID=382454 RepID=UPI0006939C1C|nr:FAD-dependent oxidoreductase [Algiphilus aromaticivorans]